MVLKELHCLSAVFRGGRKVYRCTTQNPVAGIEKPTVPKRKKQIPTADEIKAFLDAASRLTPHYYPSFLTIYQGGLRIDEVRHLERPMSMKRRARCAFGLKKGWSPKD